MGIAKDLTGLKHGKLTFVYLTDQKRGKHPLWFCVCDCGNTKLVPNHDLHKIKGCGCGVKRTTHGHRNTKLYKTWTSIKDRCYNPSCPGYVNYGGRGIGMHDEWKNNFMAFYESAMETGYSENLQIDRINNDGDYEPGNIRWVTVKQNARNRRTNRFLTINGETKCIAEWAETLGVSVDRISPRLKKYGDEYTANWLMRFIDE